MSFSGITFVHRTELVTGRHRKTSDVFQRLRKRISHLELRWQSVPLRGDRST